MMSESHFCYIVFHCRIIPKNPCYLGSMGCFQVKAITTRAMNVSCMWLLLLRRGHVPFGSAPEEWKCITGGYIQLPSIWTISIYSNISISISSSFKNIQPRLPPVGLSQQLVLWGFILFFTRGCGFSLPCLHSPDDQGGAEPAHIFMVHVYIPSWKVQIHCVFFYWIILLLCRNF